MGTPNNGSSLLQTPHNNATSMRPLACEKQSNESENIQRDNNESENNDGG